MWSNSTVMAAAEARAAWQRAANRCIVQEDAKRAPKLACCQSSSSSCKQVEAGPACAADGPDHSAVGFMPLNRNPLYSNLPPDARWLLQLQPSYWYQKGLTNGPSNALEAEVETLRACILNSVSKFSDVHQQNESDCNCADGEKNVESSFWMDKDPGTRKQEVKGLKVIYSKNAQEYIELMGIGETCELVEMDHVGYSVSKQPNEFFFDPEYPWIGNEKTEPWWHTSDRDELATLVAENSLNRIENRDLPTPPQKMCVGRDPCSRFRHFDREKILASSLIGKIKMVESPAPLFMRMAISILEERM